jgi:hypothetical protein
VSQLAPKRAARGSQLNALIDNGGIPDHRRGV